MCPHSISPETLKTYGFYMVSGAFPPPDLPLGAEGFDSHVSGEVAKLDVRQEQCH